MESLKQQKSLLRYPGGKSRAVSYIIPLIPKDTKEVVAPFFGGGSIELALASKGIKVFGYDVFSQLVCFWNEVIKNPTRLKKNVATYYPLSKDDFYKLQKRLPKETDTAQIAAIFYVLNRSSFSGSTLSGGMSPGHPRFTQTSIDRISSFKIKNLKIACLDFKESIAKHPDALLYLDPPYLIKGTLYGIKGNTHKDFDHQGLSEILKNRDNWILSYNDCPEIRELYKGYKILTPSWKYGMSTDKDSKEVIILSHDIEIPKK
jgi:DNA adenine methylase